jgi:hypothetical protein
MFSDDLDRWSVDDGDDDVTPEQREEPLSAARERMRAEFGFKRWTLDEFDAHLDAILSAAMAELEDWRSGRRSWVNLGPNAPYTPDVIATMDAQEVVKLSAYVQALATRSGPASGGLDVALIANSLRRMLLEQGIESEFVDPGDYAPGLLTPDEFAEAIVDVSRSILARLAATEPTDEPHHAENSDSFGGGDD